MISPPKKRAIWPMWSNTLRRHPWPGRHSCPPHHRCSCPLLLRLSLVCCWERGFHLLIIRDEHYPGGCAQSDQAIVRDALYDVSHILEIEPSSAAMNSGSTGMRRARRGECAAGGIQRQQGIVGQSEPGLGPLLGRKLEAQKRTAKLQPEAVLQTL